VYCRSPMDLYHPVLLSDVTTSFFSAYVGRVSSKRKCGGNVHISQTPKGLLVARGLWMKYDWPSQKANKFWKFTRFTNITSHSTTGTRGIGACLWSTSTRSLNSKQKLAAIQVGFDPRVMMTVTFKSSARAKESFWIKTQSAIMPLNADWRNCV
jgi:hypothetical protein